jgi:hypothetical protein
MRKRRREARKRRKKRSGARTKKKEGTRKKKKRKKRKRWRVNLYAKRRWALENSGCAQDGRTTSLARSRLRGWEMSLECGRIFRCGARWSLCKLSTIRSLQNDLRLVTIFGYSARWPKYSLYHRTASNTLRGGVLLGESRCPRISQDAA